MVSAVLQDPVLKLKYLKLTGTSHAFPLDSPQLYFTSLGRTAFYEGLRLYDLKEGSKVLMPDYVCHVMMAPLNQLKLQAVFYPVNHKLEPDWEKLFQLKDDNTKAMVIVNYFGFPNELERAQKFCKDNHLIFIEDNAHGFLSRTEGKPLGSFGDFSIFSFHKTLPVLNCGGLLLNRFSDKISLERLDNQIYFSRSSIAHISFWFRGLKRQLKSILKPVAASQEASSQEMLQETELLPYLNHKNSSQLLKHYNFALLGEVRRRMFAQWQDYFAQSNHDVKPLFDHLPEGIVPQAFPILVKNRQKMMEYFCKKKIQAYPWPFLPTGSKEQYFSKQVLCLPVFPEFNLKKYMDCR